jgi:hypothetical protein
VEYTPALEINPLIIHTGKKGSFTLPVECTPDLAAHTHHILYVENTTFKFHLNYGSACIKDSLKKVKLSA